MFEQDFVLDHSCNSSSHRWFCKLCNRSHRCKAGFAVRYTKCIDLPVKLLAVMDWPFLGRRACRRILAPLVGPPGAGRPVVSVPSGPRSDRDARAQPQHRSHGAPCDHLLRLHRRPRTRFPVILILRIVALSAEDQGISPGLPAGCFCRLSPALRALARRRAVYFCRVSSDHLRCGEDPGSFPR